MTSRPGRIHSEAGTIRDSVGLRRAACDSRRQRKYLKVRSLIFMSSHTHFSQQLRYGPWLWLHLHNERKRQSFVVSTIDFAFRTSSRPPPLSLPDIPQKGRQQNVGSPRRVQLSESYEITTDPDVKASVANYAIYDYSVLPRLKITLNQRRSHCHCFTRQSWSH